MHIKLLLLPGLLLITPMHTDFKALEIWLHGQLKPLCVADPVPLSQYVIALIKKDKPEKELREVCVDQLEVFLQENTILFVNDLFVALKNRSYMETSDTKAESQPPASSGTSASKRVFEPTRSDNTRDKKKSGMTDPSASVTDSSVPRQRRKRSASRKPKSSTRSRSRSHSPPPLVRPIAPSSSASSRVGRKMVDLTVLATEVGHTKRRSAELTEEIETKNVNSNRRGTSFGSTDRDDSHLHDRHSKSREPDTRRDKMARERCRSPDRDRHAFRSRTIQNDRLAESKDEGNRRRRCRNFDERGFCIFGSQCPFDHGPNALVLPSAQAAAAAITQLSASQYSSSSSAVGEVPLQSAFHSQPMAMGVSSKGFEPQLATSSSGSELKNELQSIPVYRPTPIQPPVVSVNSIISSIDGSSNPSLLGNPPPPVDSLVWNASLPLYPQTMAPVSAPFRNPIGVTNLVRHNVVPIPLAVSELPSCVANLATPPAYEPDKPQISLSESSSLSPMVMNDINSDPPLTYKPSPISERPLTVFPTTERLRQTSEFEDTSSFPCVLYVTHIPWRLNNALKLTEHFSKFGTLLRVVPRYFGLPDTALLEYSSAEEAERTFRSPEPILSNRFIRLSTMLPAKLGPSRRGRHTPYDMRAKTLMERLGRRTDVSNRYGWLQSAVDNDEPMGGEPAPSTKVRQSGRSRWRLERERNDALHDIGSGDEDDEDFEQGRLRTDRELDLGSSRFGSTGPGSELPFKRSRDRGVRSRLGSDSDTPEGQLRNGTANRDTAAYIWSKQKALAMKQRQEQLKILDKSRETKQHMLEAQSQLILRLKARLKEIVARLDVRSSSIPLDSISVNMIQRAQPPLPEEKRQLLAEAKRIQSELQVALAKHKKHLSWGTSTRMEPTNVGTTAISAVALQVLPEPLATERRKLIAEVHAALKQVEDDITVLLSKGESVVEERRRVLELKRQLVELETVRPSDLTASTNEIGLGAVDPNDFYPSRTQTKLDKRPRTLFVSGLLSEDLGDFQNALALNYLHTQQTVRHLDAISGQPVLEITFCTRDFAEAAVRLFPQFHGRPIHVSFSAPSLAKHGLSFTTTISSTVATDSSLSSLVSSTQAELPSDLSPFSSNRHTFSHSTHSSPTSTTVPTSDM